MLYAILLFFLPLCQRLSSPQGPSEMQRAFNFVADILLSSANEEDLAGDQGEDEEAGPSGKEARGKLPAVRPGRY